VLHRPNATDQYRAIQGFSQGKPRVYFSGYLFEKRLAILKSYFILGTW